MGAPTDRAPPPADAAAADVSSLPLPAPLVFQCRACRTVLGDSTAFACSVRSLCCVVLSAASSLALDAPPASARLPCSPPDAPAAIFTPLACAGCGAAVGRRYAPGPPGALPPRLAAHPAFTGLFALDVAALASYELGAHALVARADGGCGGGERHGALPVDSAAAAGGGAAAAPPPPSDAGADASSAASLAARVAALEEEVVRMSMLVLAHHEKLKEGGARGVS